ncbi:cyclase family protein [Actinospica durhamensis]|uniref:Cyclase family protein n=1 Tax=Actinospica durhamensis TaxID=1508375 RepID=A0A941ISK7_9ACTN|nr:cyclase family protein [Actinospica durhamensis]MBR7833306.1 cyclase family protein [Actinospica durhamensis]
MTASPAGSAAPRLSADQFEALFRRLREGVTFGAHDRRGALNHLTPAHVAAAAGEIRAGIAVSLANDIRHREAADNPKPARHQMIGPITPGRTPGDLQFAQDQFAMNVHGDAETHIDALCHVIYHGTLYNGVPASEVREDGAHQLSIDTAHDGIVGRGVLLDIAHARGEPWLELGDHVTADDLLAAEKAQDVRAGEGDLVFIRVGHQARRRERGDWTAAKARVGLHPNAVELLADRHIALLGGDGNSDSAPSLVEGVDFPVHVLAINALGLHLIDYLQLEDLHDHCVRLGRWSFFCTVAPLRLPGATGSPVNPIAVL